MPKQKYKTNLIKVQEARENEQIRKGQAGSKPAGGLKAKFLASKTKYSMLFIARNLEIPEHIIVKYKTVDSLSDYISKKFSYNKIAAAYGMDNLKD